VRQGARTYAAIGGTLSGFSFAAVVLLARSGIDCQLMPSSGLCDQMAISLRDKAAAAFLIAFFGCVTGAFVYAITGAEEMLSKRAHTMGLAGSGGFALGIGYAFWGLALLSHLYFAGPPNDAVAVANLMVIGVAVAAPAFLAFPAVDIKLGFGPSSRSPSNTDQPLGGAKASAALEPAAVTHTVVGSEAPGLVERSDYLWAFGPSYLVVVAGASLRIGLGSQLRAAPPWIFTTMFVLAIVLAVVSLVAALAVSGGSHQRAVTPKLAGSYAAVAAVLLWVLVLLLPPPIF
jgi:hypothetical protein